MRKIINIARRVKEAFEWWWIASSALWLIPGVPIMWAIIQGLPLDVIALYAMAGLAYSFVLANQGVPVLKEYLGRRRPALDIGVQLLHPLLIVSVEEAAAKSHDRETRWRGFFVAPNVAITNRSERRRALEVELWIRAPRHIFFLQCPPRNTPLPSLLQKIREEQSLDFVEFGRRSLPQRFDLAPWATSVGHLIFEVDFREPYLRMADDDFSALRSSMPMEFVFTDHVSGSRARVPVDHEYYGPSGIKEWPLVRIDSLPERDGPGA